MVSESNMQVQKQNFLVVALGFFSELRAEGNFCRNHPRCVESDDDVGGVRKVLGGEGRNLQAAPNW